MLQIVRHRSRSVVAHAFATSPLKLLTPRNHGHAAWVYTATYGGGLVDGDAVRLSVDIGPGAVGLLSTQASTKVYRSPAGTSVALEATIGAGGLLVVVPDPIVCFAGSTYRQTQRYELAPAAGLVLVDWLSSGRHAAGERWAFDNYSSRTTIRCDGRLVVYDALSLSATDGDLARRLGRFEVVGVVVLVGAALGADADRLVTAISNSPMARRADRLVAASAVRDCGAVVRFAGVSVEDIGHAVREHLRFVPALLGDDPWARRW